MPTFRVFQHGKQIDESVGAVPAKLTVCPVPTSPILLLVSPISPSCGLFSDTATYKGPAEPISAKGRCPRQALSGRGGMYGQRRTEKRSDRWTGRQAREGSGG